jgi:hypothetical protein
VIVLGFTACCYFNAFRKKRRAAAATLDLDVGLIHPPRAICHPKMRPYALLNLRRVALRPARHGRVVNRDPAIRQHALHISEADRELKIPPDRPKDNLRRKLATLERIRTLGH